MWIFSYILTITGVYPDDPKAVNYQARTDARINVLHEAPWFRFPYPGKLMYTILNELRIVKES